MAQIDLLQTEEVLAYQVDVFDNVQNAIRHNRKRSKNASDFTISLRLETENTNGWLNLQSQVTVGRKPSQTKRAIRTQIDLEIFKEIMVQREDAVLHNTTGFDIKPVISSFYKKKNKNEGMIPSFYCMLMKEKNEDYGLYIRLGDFIEYTILRQKNSETHTIYSAEERYKYAEGFQRRGY